MIQLSAAACYAKFAHCECIINLLLDTLWLLLHVRGVKVRHSCLVAYQHSYIRTTSSFILGSFMRLLCSQLLVHIHIYREACSLSWTL